MTRVLPNLLTLLRVLLAPAIFMLALWPNQRWLCLALYILACASDFFDGYLARKWQYQSQFGRMFDPIADKLLVLCVMIIIISQHIVTGLTLGVALIILAREIMVSGLREFMAEMNQALPVSHLSKWKTFFQMVALGLLLMGSIAFPWRHLAVASGIGCLWLSGILTVLTGFIYIRRSFRFL